MPFDTLVGGLFALGCCELLSNQAEVSDYQQFAYTFLFSSAYVQHRMELVFRTRV